MADRDDVIRPGMTLAEQRLLLTVGRILRARLPELAPSYQEDDLAALNEALAPFDPAPTQLFKDACEKGSSDAGGKS